MLDVSTPIHTETLSACPLCRSSRHETIHSGLRDRLFFAPGVWSFSRCAECRVVFLNPRLVPQEIDKAYTELYATRKAAGGAPPEGRLARTKDYLRRGFYGSRFGYTDGTTGAQRRWGALLSALPVWGDRLASQIMRIPHHPAGRLLDVGCGVGGFLLTMSRMGWEVEGVDTDARVVAACHDLGLQARAGTLEEMRYPDDSFDVVTSSHVIEHVYEPVAFLAEIRRILKPGGRLYLRTPNVESHGHRTFGSYWLPLEAPRHLFIFEPATLSNVATAAGFRAVDVRSSARASRVIATISLELRDHGRVAYRTTPSRMSRLKALLYEAHVRLLLRLGRDVGDELMLIARK